MISKLELLARKKTIQNNIIQNELDALLIINEENIYYLTGLSYKSLERAFIIIITPEKATFIIPKMELAHLKEAIGIDSLIDYWEFPAPTGENSIDVLKKELKSFKNIGIESTCPSGIALELKSFKLSLSNIVEKIRYIKSESELDLIRQASFYCDDAINQINNSVYYGMTELEILGISKNIQKNVIINTEFEYLSSSFLVAVWPGQISHQPHGIPKINDKLEAGPHISLAFLRVNGYASECERTFFTKQPTEEEINYFNIMLKARKKCFEILKPGIKAEDIDIIANSYFESKGLTQNILHRTGHGIGLGNHEGPFLAISDKTILQENMVISIEPGIYIEGVGGFRHSDTVLITHNGYELLTHIPTQINDLIFTKIHPINRLKGKIAKKMYKLK
ncbi:MAG: aminopeptidase P family protein [Candidatus Marinimicrobia bacterium]|nr:aminopeptidase P family protein [Candidatus Neomarinimicrobiota bacterium]